MGLFGDVVLVMFKYYRNTYESKSVVEICVVLFKQHNQIGSFILYHIANTNLSFFLLTTQYVPSGL